MHRAKDIDVRNEIGCSNPYCFVRKSDVASGISQNSGLYMYFG
jgi:hypothetical protein